MVGVQQNRNPVMGRYRANGSRPRAKLSDSAPKIKSDEKRDERKETNDTLVIQHPNEISHDAMLGCWDSFGTLFLMGALVLIGKLI
jgi:hypothetical protein